MLYDLIPDALQPYTNLTPMPLVASHGDDGVIGTFLVDTQSKQVNHYNPKSTITNEKNATPPTPSHSKTFESIRSSLCLPINLNSVHSTPTGKTYQVNIIKYMPTV
jgi:hypothetical protein